MTFLESFSKFFSKIISLIQDENLNSEELMNQIGKLKAEIEEYRAIFTNLRDVDPGDSAAILCKGSRINY